MAGITKKLSQNPFSPSVIKQCTCENESQDKLYGRRMRLWNSAPSKGSKPRRYRCTVCLREQEF